MEGQVIKKKKTLWLKIIGAIVLSLIIFVCGVVTFFNFSHNYYEVYGPSMAPTLNNSTTGTGEAIDGVFVSKIKNYTRGDIIVLNKNYGIEGMSERFVIKRLIAVAGDKITVKFYNGEYRIFLIKAGETAVEVLEEEYLSSYAVNEKLYENFNNMTLELAIKTDGGGYITIPENSIFVLGDNRENSTDSSSYGPKLKASVVGKVDYIIYGNTNIYGQVIKQFFGWD